MEIVINTKNAGEEVLTFDCSKIAAAIAKAFESIQPVMEEAVQKYKQCTYGLCRNYGGIHTATDGKH